MDRKEVLRTQIKNLQQQILMAFDQGNFTERDRLCRIKDDILDEFITLDE